MKVMEIISTKTLKQEHDYEVTKYFDYNHSKSVTRFIAVGKVFDTRNRARTLRTFQNKTDLLK